MIILENVFSNTFSISFHKSLITSLLDLTSNFKRIRVHYVIYVIDHGTATPSHLSLNLRALHNLWLDSNPCITVYKLYNSTRVSITPSDRGGRTFPSRKGRETARCDTKLKKINCQLNKKENCGGKSCANGF